MTGARFLYRNLKTVDSIVQDPDVLVFTRLLEEAVGHPCHAVDEVVVNWDAADELVIATGALSGSLSSHR